MARIDRILSLLEKIWEQLITAIGMYHFCQVFYRRLSQDLPLVANTFTIGGMSRKPQIYNVKDFER
ncbi:hypothetical protein [Robertmurraya yapensis (ex Hitch et al 2024)]